MMIIHNFSLGQEKYQSNQYLEAARKNKFTDIDKAIHNFEKSIDYFKYKKDTLNLINSINELSDLYAHHLNYGKSYDGHWQALLLAEKSNDEFSKARVYQSLGWLYSFYNRNKKALEHLNRALQIDKALYLAKEISVDYMISDYFSLANFYRYNKDYATARSYIDSCYLYFNSVSTSQKTKNFYLESEKAFLLATENQFTEAEHLLDGAKDFFAKNEKSYLVVIHFFFARLYQMQGLIEKSKQQYNSSLHISERYNSHMNYQIINHKELSQLYYDSGQYEKAFLHIKKAIGLEHKIFGINSKNNEYLFEIKDQYRIQKNEQAQIIKEQKLLKLEHQQKIASLRIILLTVILLFLLLYGIIVYKNLKRKHHNEKIQQRLKLKENKETIALKNRELTKSALQLVEKEEFIKGLKNALTKSKSDLNLNSVNKIIKSIQLGVGNNWKDFEARFIDINQNFYKNIKADHPNLTQNDLKICALVKLNFSSKDMAALLGISIESVHTSRYRLRKKLNIQRQDNLNEYIAQY